MKSYLIWVFTVIVVSVAAFIYLIGEDKRETRPVLELSYFVDDLEVADSVIQKMSVDINQKQFFWFGVEPEKPDHLMVASQLIKKLKTEKKIQKIIIDQELDLKNDELELLQSTDVMSLKEKLYSLGEKIAELEKNQTAYIVVSASIYTSSLLKKNPINILKEKYGIKPLTISFSYFPVTAEDEKKMLFQCSTDDHTGTADWGCVVTNRARFVRRKIKTENQKKWLAFMDASSENDFVLVLKKNDK